jgi:DNA-binding transcriptional ArsR family regulator
MNETTVSQALRLLRAAGTVTARRSGRVNCYQLTDGHIHDLIDQIAGPGSRSGHTHAAT